MPKVIVNFTDGSREEAEISGSDFLLTELEDRGIKIARGCFAGSCGVCRMEVLNGSQNLTPADIVEKDTIEHIKNTQGGDFRMACSCKVTGDIEIRAERYISLKI